MTTTAPPEASAGFADELRAMTPTQQYTFNELLAVGGDRPFAPPGLVEQLRAKLEAGVGDPLERWTERNLWLSKSALFSALRCEGGFKADREKPRVGGKHVATVIGDVSHRAIQLAHTHPGRPVADYVRVAVGSLRGVDADFDAFYTAADMALQSDVLMQSASRVTAFLDSWPPLHDDWAPRFEEPMQAKIGQLTLSARVDLLLGRPRPNGRQTMLVVDWKSGGLREHHDAEAGFHALVSTLRFGVPPYRSTVYSLASGTFTDPDVDAPMLLAAADRVVAGVTAIVDVLTERRPPAVFCGASWCGYCVEHAIPEPTAPAATS